MHFAIKVYNPTAFESMVYTVSSGVPSGESTIFNVTESGIE